MIIYDRHLGRTGVGPTERDAPLIIDADRVVAVQIAFQRFQTVAGRHGHIREANGAVELEEFS